MLSWRHLVNATEITAGLAGSNGSLPPGGWLSYLRVDCLYTAGSAPGPTLEYGRTSLSVLNSYFPLFCSITRRLFSGVWTFCRTLTHWERESESAARLHWRLKATLSSSKIGCKWARVVAEWTPRRPRRRRRVKHFTDIEKLDGISLVLGRWVKVQRPTRRRSRNIGCGSSPTCDRPSLDRGWSAEKRQMGTTSAGPLTDCLLRYNNVRLKSFEKHMHEAHTARHPSVQCTDAHSGQWRVQTGTSRVPASPTGNFFCPWKTQPVTSLHVLRSSYWLYERQCNKSCLLRF